MCIYIYVSGCVCLCTFASSFSFFVYMLISMCCLHFGEHIDRLSVNCLTYFCLYIHTTYIYICIYAPYNTIPIQMQMQVPIPIPIQYKTIQYNTTQYILIRPYLHTYPLTHLHMITYGSYSTVKRRCQGRHR